MKTKRILSAVLALSMALLLFGCGAAPLPEGFDEEKVTARAEEIVGYASSGDYDAIIACLRSDLSSSVTADQLKESWAPTYDKIGAFQSVDQTALYGTKDKSTGEEYAVAVVVCTHENGSAIYTLSFDADLNLVGLYLK